MARRNTFFDTATWEADQSIRAIMGRDDEEGNGRKLRRILLKVINNELTARQKEIIMLYYFKEMDIVSISRRLEVTPQAVSAAMARARVKMFKVLQYYI